MMGPFKSFWQLTPVKCESGGGYRRQPFRRTAAQRILFSTVFFVGERKNCLNAWSRLNWNRTRVCTVRDRRLIAWVMAQAVRRRLLNVEVQLRSQFCLRFMVDKMILGQFLHRVLRVSLSASHHRCSNSSSTLCSYRKDKRAKPGKSTFTLKKRIAIFNRLFH